MEFIIAVLLKMAFALIEVILYAGAFSLINTITKGRFLNWMLSGNVVVKKR